MGWWVAELLRDNPALLISWVVWVIGSIVLHELSHGWAAIRLGDRTPIETGHMTWNPMVHMGGMSLVAFLIVGIAWGAMPVSPYRLRGRYGHAIVAAAGPGMNLALAFASAIVGGVWAAHGGGVGEPLYTNMLLFFRTGVFLNLLLMGFNLLPAPPLDGSTILASFSRQYRELLAHPQAGILSLLAFLFVFFYVFDYIVGPARAAAEWGIAVVSQMVSIG